MDKNEIIVAELDQEKVPASTVPARVTATMLGDIVMCEMRLQLDIHGDPAVRAPVNGFVEMLWSQGNRHEAAIIAGLPGVVADIRDVPMAGRVETTVAAMAGEADWIVGARLLVDDLEGRPDLLHRDGDTWRAGDVKSGGAFQPNGRDPRPEYVVQAGLYGLMLESLGLGAGDRVFVIGSDAQQVWFDMDAPITRGGRTIANFTTGLVARARAIRDGTEHARPALSSICGLCVWRATCRAALVSADDLTLVPALGRSVRTALEPTVTTVAALADLDVEALAAPGGRTLVPGVGAGRLALFRERARVLTSGAPPFAIEPLGLSRRDVEHHLDLETDPTCNDFCYLHGVLRRRRVDGADIEDYVHFLAEDPSREREAFIAAVDFLSADPSALITTFSAFERTTYRRLAKRYPDVGFERVEALFESGRCVDLYFDVILKSTHWPLNSLGLKAVARHLGFQWSDAQAGGANSIAWFVDWMETRDDALLERILTYNREDCIASRVVLDGALALPVMPVLPWPHAVASR